MSSVNYNNKYRRRTVISIILVVLLCIASWVTLRPISAARAEASKYTTIVEDFANEPDFKPDEFEKMDWDNIHILRDEIIQIAESSDNELFIYVSETLFRDSDKRFTQIRMSTSIGDNARWADYDLRLVDTYYSLHKYVVKDFTVLSDALRYYDIPCIFRPYDETVDGKLEGSNTGTSKAIDISQLWTASTVDGKVSYTARRNESVVVTSQYVGNLSYHNETVSGGTITSVCYIAFDTDISIDRIYEADVSFGIISETISGKVNNEFVPYHTDTIYANEHGSASSGFWFWSKKHYTWTAIQSIEDFKAGEDLSAEALERLKDKKWVIRFWTLSVDYSNTTSKPVYTTYRSTDTTILRLNYLKDGKTYNVGVVSNKQIGNDGIDNPSIDPSSGTGWDQFVNWFKTNWRWIVIGLACVLGLIILAPFLPFIISAIVNLLVLLFKGLWWLISAPVRLIVALVKKDE